MEKMNNYLSEVGEILGLAESNSTTDRRTFLQKLNNAYANEEYVKAINIQTANDSKSATSWNQILLAVHRFSLSEAERRLGKNSSRNCAITAQSACSGLMLKTMSLAIDTNGISLDCDDLMANFFQIWENNIYRLYHDTCVNVLIHHVLTNEIYRLRITAQQWQEILRLIQKMYAGSSNTFKSVLLDAMRLVVQYGCTQSQLLPDVMKMLPFLEKIFQETDTSKEFMLRQLYKLTYTVCLEIGTESRIALCRFSESILPPIIYLEGCPEMYKMLLLFVKIHHPGGVTRSVDDDDDFAAYAQDWNKWRNIIRGIHGNILRDIKSETLEPHFLKLCCDVYRQIFEDPTYLAEASNGRSVATQSEPPRKVRRVPTTVGRPVDLLLTKNDLLEIWPFTQILTALLGKYPDTLKPNEYPAFLKIVAKFVGAALDNEAVLASLYQLLTVLINLEWRHYIAAEETESVKISWRQIWETVVRASSVDKNEIPCHELLQSMIWHRGGEFDLLRAFLRLYTKGTIGWSPSSIETLLRFCCHAPIPADESWNPRVSDSGSAESSMRDSLLRWALNVPPLKFSADIPIASLGKLLACLAVGSFGKRDSCRSQEDVERSIVERELLDDRESKASSNIEICHLSLIFGLDIFDDDAQEPIATEEAKVTATHEIAEEILEILVDTLANLLSDDNEMTARVTVTHVAATVISNLAMLNIDFQGGKMSKLVGVFAETYKDLLSAFTTSLSRQPCVGPLRALERLYCTKYHAKVEKVIAEITPMNFIEYIETLVRVGNSENRNVDAFRVRNSADKILTHFCCARDCERAPADRTKILKNFLEILDPSRCNSKYTYGACVRRVLRVLAALGSSDLATRSDGSLEAALLFLRRLSKRQQDERIVRGVLMTIPRLMNAASSSSSSSTNDSLANILSETNERLAHGNYGPLAHAEFVRCLGQAIPTNYLKQRIGSAKESSLQLIRRLVSYVGSPFYVVRLEVARALRAVFSSKELDVPWKFSFFEKVAAAANNPLDAVDSSDDELANRRTTAVHIVAAVIRGSDSRLLHARALRAIVLLSAERDLKVALIKRALLLSTWRNPARDEGGGWPRRLLEMNLRELLSGWLEAGHSLERFPWTLTDCDSHQDFARRYVETLLIVKLQRLELDDFEVLCNTIGVPFGRTIEDAFAPITAALMSMTVNRNGNEREANYARAIHASLRANADVFSNMKNFNDLLDEKLDRVIMEIVGMLHERQRSDAVLDADFVEDECLERCLRLLEEDLSLERGFLIEHLVTQRPSTLQRILLTLVSEIHEAEFADYELEAFHRYARFCTSVLGKMSETQFDPMSLYFVRDVAHSLLCFVKKETSLSEAACSFYQKFFGAALPTRASDVGEILSSTVSGLVPVAQRGRVKGASALLHYLIVEKRYALAGAIEKLDSFPNHEAFIELKRVHDELKYGANQVYSLEMEIGHFLNATNEKMLSCSLEGLSRLGAQLSTRKNELRQLYGELEKLRGFAEDCASSVLHRLIYRLVQLTRSSDPYVSLEAAKSLGELGPADLTTLILHPEKDRSDQRHFDNDPRQRIENLTLDVVSRLSDYLVDSDIQLRVASADALHAIFSTSWHCKINNSNLYRRVYPFVARSVNRSAAGRAPIRIDADNFEILINRSDDLWIPKSYGTYSKWILEISSRILDCFFNFYAKALKPVCARSVEFSEMLLPRLVNLLIATNKSCANLLCGCMDRFFGHLRESLGGIKESIERPDCTIKFGNNNNNNNDVSRSHECIRFMLSLVNSMRVDSIYDNTPLALDYLLVAIAADYNSVYFTSLLYAEMSCQALVARRSRATDEKPPGSWLSAIDAICEFDPPSGRLLQHIVREAYLHIGDPDSIYGCGLEHFIDSSFRAQHYTHLGQWDKVVLEQDTELECSSSATRRDLLIALQQSGHQYLVGLVANAGYREADNVDDFAYETAWRLADWGLLESRRTTNLGQQNLPISCSVENHDYHLWHYCALKCLRDNNLVGLSNALTNARSSVVKSLRTTTLECSRTVYPVLSRLQMLREIEVFAAETNEPDRYNRLINKWSQQDFADSHDFQYVESILSQRLAMYRLQKFGSDATAMKDIALIDTHLKMAQVAEKQGYLSMAYRTLDSLAEIVDLSDAAQHQLIYQKALLAWKEKEHNIGRYLLRDLIKRPTLNGILRAKALRICGNWMAEGKCEKPQAIISNYYDESIRISSDMDVSSSDTIASLTDGQADLGQFADAQYQQIIRFAKSAQYENLVKCSINDDDGKRTSGAIVSFDKTDETEAMSTYRQQVNDDASELEDIKREKSMYLILAASNYLLALQNGNDHDLLVFRLVSLWLDNTLHEELNKLLQEHLTRIASYKFIALLSQVAPHMSNVSNNFTEKVNDIMLRCAKEHPHHTLPVLLALQNTHKDVEYQCSDRGPRKSLTTQPEARLIAAAALISQLMHSEIRSIIQQISQLSNALIMLANYNLPSDQSKRTGVPLRIPRNQAIMKIRKFYQTIVPTITLNVSPSGNYESVVGVLEYEAKFEIPGGLNEPKKVICVGTDGIRRRQLVKGQDDLRQDAVMQQVFMVVNTMLKTSRETKRRRLHIRTYKIVPLSQRSGVLEWCENTLPISHVLTDIGGKPGMHTKYYPNDWSVTKCKLKMKAVERQEWHVKKATFLEVCENLRPAFHHFFMEKYPSAETWFERRLAYVRSVATTSMVGYVLGLGDRHVNNILIDQTTAEVVHIDFGIAFAQGKVLRIPETVPFRLTRDIEVAMGISGVEGVMRRSCEETVAVLRDRRKTLITVLQVLLYDPLFSWTITPVRTNDTQACTQDQDKQKTNEIAEKALLRIDQKLQGTADGLTLSISGQVERLIQQARDPANLCRLFSGWQPYL